MPSTTNFGPLSVDPGTQTFGPMALNDADSQFTLAIDRTPTGGFNDTPAVTMRLSFEQSDDGGSSWNEICSGTLIGGQVFKNGVLRTVSSVSSQLGPGTSRQGRAVVVTSGSSVVVLGSLVTS